MPADKPARPVFSRALTYLDPYKGPWIWALFLMTILALVEITFPWLMKDFINRVLPSGHLQSILTWCALVLVIRISEWSLIYLRDLRLSHISSGYIRDIRNKLFHTLQRLDVSFYDRTRTGHIMSRVLSDVDLLEESFAHMTIIIVMDGMKLFVIYAIMISLNWRLSLVVLPMFPILAFAFYRFRPRLRKVRLKARQRMADISDRLQQNITGSREIRAFTMENEEILHFHKLTHDFYRKSFSRRIIQTLLNISAKAVVTTGLLILFGVGGREMLLGRMNLGQFIAFHMYFMLLTMPVHSLTMMGDMFVRVRVAFERIFDLLDSSPDVKETENPVTLPKARGHVRFEHVDFAYTHGGPPALSGINIDVAAGLSVALVGPSGAGKSTFINLIPRFYDPVHGRILIDEIPIKDLQLADLRSHIGIVQQDAFLFAGTIMDNILFGRRSAKIDQAMDAARKANAHEFIKSLPEKYDTVVGERGIRLSGGQKQRIAIARVILKDPEILILDEATSALDSESEAQVQESFKALMQGRTSFVIAHRLSTILHSDRIMVLDRGQVAGSGRHEELLDSCSLYRNLYERQFAAAG